MQVVEGSSVQVWGTAQLSSSKGNVFCLSALEAQLQRAWPRSVLQNLSHVPKKQNKLDIEG